MPSVFTPVSTTGTGMPSSHFLPSAARPSLRPSYPQHAAPGLTWIFLFYWYFTLIFFPPPPIFELVHHHFFSLPGFPPHQPFQHQPPTTGRPAAFPLAGPSVPAANLSGPPLQPPSSTSGGLPPMPSPGVPPTGFMPPTSLPSGLMSPSSQTGAPLPVYPGSLQNQPGPPMASGPFAPPGSGYPQGGPGAPAVKLYQPPPVAPPPTGTAEAELFLDSTKDFFLPILLLR